MNEVAKNKYTIVLRKYNNGTVHPQIDGGVRDFEYLELQNEIIENNKSLFGKHPNLKRLSINVLETKVE